ncbi:MAG: hypothetical protein AAF591_17365 [Verrucomicrobiota bacterium]
MKIGERSEMTRGARWGAMLALVVLAAGVVLVRTEPVWVGWVLFGVALAGLLGLLLGKAKVTEERSEDEMLEVAREAIRSEADRLEARREEMEKKLMAYGEWMEFPDFDELHEVNWAVSGRSEQDTRVAELLDVEAERMMKRFSEGEYWEGTTFQTRVLLAELMDFMESIAKVYQPDSEKPFLETNLEAMFKAVNRASLQVILLLEEMPIVEAQEWNLRKVSEGVRTASKVYEKYQWARPFLNPVRYLWHGSKLLFVSNPLTAVGWIAGSEILWKGGAKLGKKAMNAYLLSLVRQTLGIIAWETASIFDATHRFRNPDFVYGVELAHLVSKFPMDRETLRGALQELGKIPFRSTFDRVFLYRCVAQQVSPKPERFSQGDLMDEDVRESIYGQLRKFLEAHVGEATDGEIAKWEKGVKGRLGVVE